MTFSYWLLWNIVNHPLSSNNNSFLMCCCKRYIGKELLFDFYLLRIAYLASLMFHSSLGSSISLSSILYYASLSWFEPRCALLSRNINLFHLPSFPSPIIVTHAQFQCFFLTPRVVLFYVPKLLPSFALKPHVFFILCNVSLMIWCSNLLLFTSDTLCLFKTILHIQVGVDLFLSTIFHIMCSF